MVQFTCDYYYHLIHCASVLARFANVPELTLTSWILILEDIIHPQKVLTIANIQADFLQFLFVVKNYFPFCLCWVGSRYLADADSCLLFYTTEIRGVVYCECKNGPKSILHVFFFFSLCQKGRVSGGQVGSLSVFLSSLYSHSSSPFNAFKSLNTSSSACHQ